MNLNMHRAPHVKMPAKAATVRGASRYFRATESTAGANDSGRLITFRLSDETVARDGHTIKTSGWDLTDYLKNPSVLFAHDASSPPVARCVDIGIRGSALYGTADFAPPEASPFADEIFRLTKGGFLNACSVSWQPLEWKYSTDRNRVPGSIDFIRQSLLEWSIVPVPASVDALVTARARGISTASLHRWAEKALDGGGQLILPRGQLEALHRAAKMPTPRHAVSTAGDEKARARARVAELRRRHDEDCLQAARAEQARNAAPRTSAEALARVAALRAKHP